jgi:hypothetical protein
MLNKDYDINCNFAINKKAFFALGDSFIEKVIDRYFLLINKENNVYSSYE